MHITFLGGVGTVTGSKYLIEAGDRKILVDCGLFQGYKQFRLRNWAPPPVDPSTIDAVVLTHAHIDHSGYLPVLVRNGYRGRIVATNATRDLCEILLPDSGYLQEKEADFANRHGTSKHHPALPLYTKEEAEDVIPRFSGVEFGEDTDLGGGVSIRMLRAGHILGAAMVRLSHEGRHLLFSGDLGRPGDATMPDPETVRQADWLVVESTYGNRSHAALDPEDALADVVNRAASRGGSVLIPSFAVGRAQSLLYHLHRLKADGRIPDIPIVLDSPMAINATDIFCRHVDDHRLTRAECVQVFGGVRYTRTVEESKSLTANGFRMPMILISASGMATGGRILHHLRHFAPDHRNAILFAGYQAGGTRGASMTGGARSVKIFGEYVPIRAEVDNLDMLSAHADADEIMGWLAHFESPPRRTFITHGEPAASDALRHRIEEDLRWPCLVPDYRDRVALD
ncbi:MAG: MBL fold metallo-hydrolase [Proteobacteria bacterium]|nr:MBL fold metallo-hydrolase [Pseudomonadota bacterium]